MIGIQRGSVVRVDTLGLQSADPTAGTQGLEGTVVHCSQTPYLCKLYARPRTPTEAVALQRLVDLREWNLTQVERRVVDQSFSWPVHRVIASDSALTTVGVLIPAAEPRFWFRYNGGWHLRDGQHVTRARSVAGCYGLAARARWVNSIATSWDVLDRHSLVYGDPNSRNLVFAESGANRVYFLDCDGIRPEGDPTVEYRVQSNWYDPYPGAGPTRQSDRYLFALWVARVLAARMVPPPRGHSVADAIPPLPERTEILDLLDRGLSAPGARPGPGEYMPVIHRVVAALGS